MSQLIEDFKKYQDEFGLTSLTVNDGRGEITQNGALFTMEYLLCLLAYQDHPVLEPQVEAEIERVREVFAGLEVLPGLTQRFPGSTEFDSMDNGAALHAFSKLFGEGEMALRKLEHGETTRAEFISEKQNFRDSMRFYPLAWVLSGFKAPRFFWNSEEPKKFCFEGWHGRSPGHMAMLRYCAGSRVGLFGNFTIWVSQFLGCFADTGNTDARKLPYIDWQVLKSRGWFWKLSYKLWCWVLMRQYKRGMQDVYAIYYQDANHPISKYSPKFAP